MESEPTILNMLEELADNNYDNLVITHSMGRYHVYIEDSADYYIIDNSLEQAIKLLYNQWIDGKMEYTGN